jgi:hypothetical protein
LAGVISAKSAKIDNQQRHENEHHDHQAHRHT